MNPQIHALQQIFGMLFGGANNVAKAVSNDVHAGVNAVGNTAIGKAFNSINPLHAQTALSPESLRPNQEVHDYLAPYNIHGNQQAVGWMPHFAPTNPTVPMPQVLGLPDYTVRPNPSAYMHSYVPVDSSFIRSNPHGFMPKAQFILPAQPQHYGRDFINPGGPV